MFKLATKNQRGFTLIEILVAITIIGLVLGVSINTFTSNSSHIDEVVNDVERAIRYSVDEAALRNTIIRTRFYLDGKPQKMSVEYGPDDSFVIPISQIEPADNSVLKEDENKKKDKEFNKKFNRVPEFSDGPRNVHDSVRIIGVGSSLSGLLYLEGQASIYTYPSGEKDGGIIILGDDSIVTAVSFDPFLLGFKYERKLLDPDILYEELEAEQDKIAQEIFEAWIKK